MRQPIATPSFFATFTKGRSGHTKLLTYDLKKLITVGGLLSMFCTGTVFTMDLNILRSVLSCVLLAGISAAVSTWLEIDESESMQTLTQQVGKLVPFVLGLYVSLAFSRWWALREKALGSVFSSLSNVAMMMSCALPDPKWDARHEQIAKFGLASIELVTKAARHQDTLDSLLHQDLLTNEEIEALSPLPPYQRALAVWAWILRICSDGLQDKGPRFAVLQAECLQAREGIQTIHTYLYTQLPFAYVHLLTWLVNVQNFVVAVTGGVVFAIALDQGNYVKCAQEVFMIIIVCVIYEGLLDITYVIHDPFGDDLMDFPVQAYTSYVAASVNAVQKAQHACPAIARLQASEEGGISK